MKVLVTGANGFIGSNLVKALVEAGHKVVALFLPGTDISVFKSFEVEAFPGDITQPDTLVEPMKGVEGVFHLAALVSDFAPWRLFDQVTVQGTENVIRAAIGAGASRFLLVSSLAVHDFSGHVDGDEDTPRNCPSYFPYGRAKMLAEDVSLEYHASGRIGVTVVRPGVFPFGENDMTSFYHLAEAMKGGYLGYINGGRSLTCTAAVENLANGMVLAMEAGDVALGNTFIISDDVKISWRDLFGKIADALGVKHPSLSIPYKAMWPVARSMEATYKLLGINTAPVFTRYRIGLMRRDFHFVNNKAKKILGYKPAIGLDEAIAKAAEWYKKASR